MEIRHLTPGLSVAAQTQESGFLEIAGQGYMMVFTNQPTSNTMRESAARCGQEYVSQFELRKELVSHCGSQQSR